MLDPEENNPSDIPDYDDLEEEAFPPLPPPHSPGQGGQEDGEPFADGEEGEVSKLADVPATKRKSVKRPQPKLDSQRLISERGLPALRTLFDNVRFKGKGHEAEDLRLLMQKMENWAHRLYPKLQFEDFIDKVEKLGSKKEVQTCLKRIRLDMPLTHEDFMDGEEQAPPHVQVFGDPDPFSRDSVVYAPPEPVHSTPAPAAPSLTEEQHRRMELNKRRALERRLARQQQLTDSQTANTPEKNEPTSVSAENGHKSSEQDEKVQDLDPDPSISMDLDLDPSISMDLDLDPSISSLENPSQPPATNSDSPPAIDSLPAVHSEPPPAIDSDSPPATGAVDSASPPTIDSLPAVDSESPPAANSAPPPATGSDPPPATDSAPPQTVDSASPPAIDSDSPPATDAVDSTSPPTIDSPPAASSKPPPATDADSPPATGSEPTPERGRAPLVLSRNSVSAVRKQINTCRKTSITSTNCR